MKKKLPYFLLLFCCISLSIKGYAQNLSAGNIAFIGFNTDPGPLADEDHSFTWIALTDIPANEVIYFTEQGVDTNTMSWFANTEGHYSWTAPSGGLPCGSIVHIYESVAAPDVLIAQGGGTMSALLSGTGWNLSAGDQILAYQASAAQSPIASTTFITGIHMEDDQATGESNGWTSTSYSGTGVSYCMLPPGLTNGVNCISLFSGAGNPEIDNVKYTGTLTGLSSSLLSSINSIYVSSGGNWTANEVTPIDISVGSYSPNVTCAAPCTDPTVPTITASANPVCVGNSTTLNISGTLNDATQWSIYTGSCGGTLLGTTTTSSFVVTPAGPSTTYYVRGEGGCVTPGSCGTVTVNVSSISLTASSQSNVSCFGGSNASASVTTATGGTAPYSYNWTPGNPPGDGTSSVTGLTAGSWTCTVTDANGCNASQSFTVTQPSALTLTPASQTNIACNGGATGAATVNTATGGTGPYTYNWTPGNPTGDGTTSVSGLTAGTWTCTATDANGCTTSQSFTITQPVAALALTPASQTNIACNGGATGAATVNTATGGTGPYTYNWTPGNPTGDGTTSVSGLTAGTWTCTATDANGCTTSQSFTITQPVAALVLTPNSQNNVSCFGGSNASASVNAATGGTAPYTYNWTPGNPSGDGTTSVTGLTAGTWTCTVTDVNGCTTSQSFTITQPSTLALTPASQTNIACNGGATGAATVNTATGGTGPYTYNWTPGNPTGDGTTSVSGLTAGTWTCNVTDANSCTTSQSFTITQPTSLVATAIVDNNVTCNGGNDGGATGSATGGTAPYTYLWSNGATTTSITGVIAGTYNVTITDANGCTDVASITITESSATVIANAVVNNNVSCNGGTNGSATATATGGTAPYTYLWSNTATTATISGVAAGTYNVTITDAIGCSDNASITITEPTALVASAIVDNNASCNGGADGSASSSATGGTAPYTYLWSNASTTASLTGVVAGTYNVTITDANGCTDNASITITEPTALVATAIVTNNVSCNGGNDGGATGSAIGGTPPYTYLWSNGSTTASLTGVVAGTYNVTITDANGCTDNASITIAEPTALVVIANVNNNVSCFNDTDGAASSLASGGTAPYTYLWSNGATNTSITGVVAGTYNVTITDANGCTDMASVTITEPTAIDNTVSENTTGILTANASDGGMTYQWYECPNTLLTGETTQNFEPTALGDYKVSITFNGCTVESACYTVTTLGTSTFEDKLSFVIYPNPTNGLLNIDSNFDGDFIIVNQLGQTVKNFKVNATVENIINVENIADGIYYIKGSNGTQIHSQRLLIKK